MPTVDQVGVRCRGWIRLKPAGIAWNTAMDKVVRAVGRMVVRVDAAAELRTIRMRSLVSPAPMTLEPKTAWPSTDSTSPALSGLPRPIPLSPMPE